MPHRRKGFQFAVTFGDTPVLFFRSAKVHQVCASYRHVLAVLAGMHPPKPGGTGDGLRCDALPIVVGTVIRVEVDYLPSIRRTRQKALWLSPPGDQESVLTS